MLSATRNFVLLTEAAQGNGGGSLTAIETSETPTFQVIVHKRDQLAEEGLVRA